MVLKDEGGKVVAELSSQMQPEVQKVTDVSKRRQRPGPEVRRELPGQPVRCRDHA